MRIPSFKAIEKLLIDNSPIVLTAIGVAGTITTAVLTHRAALKAQVQFDRARDAQWAKTQGENPPDLSRKEHVKAVWVCYIPPVAAGTLTVASIISANHIGTKRAAAVAAAYTITEKAYTEYRDKVVEKLGEAKEKDIQDEIVRERVRNNPPNATNMIIIGKDEGVLCCDMFSGRYFKSSVETLKNAQNYVNHEVNHNMYATLTDFYDRIGVPKTDVSDELGWNSDKLLELEFTHGLTEDMRPYVGIRFLPHPVREYSVSY